MSSVEQIVYLECESVPNLSLTRNGNPEMTRIHTFAGKISAEELIHSFWNLPETRWPFNAGTKAIAFAPGKTYVLPSGKTIALPEGGKIVENFDLTGKGRGLTVTLVFEPVNGVTGKVIRARLLEPSLLGWPVRLFSGAIEFIFLDGRIREEWRSMEFDPAKALGLMPYLGFPVRTLRGIVSRFLVGVHNELVSGGLHGLAQVIAERHQQKSCG